MASSMASNSILLSEATDEEIREELYKRLSKTVFNKLPLAVIRQKFIPFVQIKDVLNLMASCHSLHNLFKRFLFVMKEQMRQTDSELPYVIKQIHGGDCLKMRYVLRYTFENSYDPEYDDFTQYPDFAEEEENLTNGWDNNGWNTHSLLTFLFENTRMIWATGREVSESPWIDELDTIGRLKCDMMDLANASTTVRFSDNFSKVSFFGLSSDDINALYEAVKGEILLEHSSGGTTYFEGNGEWHRAGMTREPHFKWMLHLINGRKVVMNTDIQL